MSCRGRSNIARPSSAPASASCHCGASLTRQGDHEGVALLDQELRDLRRESNFGIVELGNADLDGRIMWFTDEARVGFDISGRAYFQALRREPGREVVLGTPIRDARLDRWLLPVLRRTFDAGGEPDGYALIAFDVDLISAQLRGIEPRPGRLLLQAQLDTGHVTAANHRLEFYLGDFNRSLSARVPVLEAARAQPEGRMAYASAADGRPLMTAWRVNASTRTVLVAGFDVNAEMARYSRQRDTLLVGLATLLLAGLALALAWRRNLLLREQLTEQATNDPLTGLDNRRALQAKLVPLLRDGSPDGSVFACLVFDLDHFKSINDRWGHAAGDIVLRDVAAVLRGNVRAGDIVCRWGGEEMLVVLVNCSQTQAGDRAEHLRRAIAALYADRGGAGPRVTTSIGVACFPQHGSTFEALSHAADGALYRAKRDGRDLVRVAELEAA